MAAFLRKCLPACLPCNIRLPSSPHEVDGLEILGTSYVAVSNRTTLRQYICAATNCSNTHSEQASLHCASHYLVAVQQHFSSSFSPCLYDTLINSHMRTASLCRRCCSCCRSSSSCGRLSETVLKRCSSSEDSPCRGSAGILIQKVKAKSRSTS
jgi:hypothetical protein